MSVYVKMNNYWKVDYPYRGACTMRHTITGTGVNYVYSYQVKKLYGVSTPTAPYGCTVYSSQMYYVDNDTIVWKSQYNNMALMSVSTDIPSPMDSGGPISYALYGTGYNDVTLTVKSYENGTYVRTDDYTMSDEQLVDPRWYIDITSGSSTTTETQVTNKRYITIKDTLGLNYTSKYDDKVVLVYSITQKRTKTTGRSCTTNPSSPTNIYGSMTLKLYYTDSISYTDWEVDSIYNGPDSITIDEGDYSINDANRTFYGFSNVTGRSKIYGDDGRGVLVKPLGSTSTYVDGLYVEYRGWDQILPLGTADNKIVYTNFKPLIWTLKDGNGNTIQGDSISVIKDGSKYIDQWTPTKFILKTPSSASDYGGATPIPGGKPIVVPPGHLPDPIPDHG